MNKFVTSYHEFADSAQVKASGGIRSYQDAKAMLLAGASRIGTSAGPAIVSGSPAAHAPSATY
jgi:deoxyribose-phosphate aldolase